MSCEQQRIACVFLFLVPEAVPVFVLCACRSRQQPSQTPLLWLAFGGFCLSLWCPLRSHPLGHTHRFETPLPLTSLGRFIP